MFQDLVTIIEKRFVNLFDIIRLMSKFLSYFKAVTFYLLHFTCFILCQKVGTFRVKKLLRFASKVVTFRVNVTFRVKSCYISRQLLHSAA